MKQEIYNLKGVVKIIWRLISWLWLVIWLAHCGRLVWVAWNADAFGTYQAEVYQNNHWPSAWHEHATLGEDNECLRCQMFAMFNFVVVIVNLYTYGSGFKPVRWWIIVAVALLLPLLLICL